MTTALTKNLITSLLCSPLILTCVELGRMDVISIRSFNNAAGMWLISIDGDFLYLKWEKVMVFAFYLAFRLISE